MKLLFQKILFVTACFLLSLSSAFALGSVGDKKQNDLTLPFDCSAYSSDKWVVSDRNGDGKIDYALQIDKAGNNVYEAFDFNYDGKMDDFYIYDKGVLSVRELDTNYDGKIDMWVYMYQGVYVAGYERDTDFDGKLDVVKDFGKKAVASVSKP